MKYRHTKAQVQKYTKAAMEAMAARGIPTEPGNFAVWYCYASGENPALNRALDGLIAEDAAFDDERNEQLYEKFFGFEAKSTALREASQRIESAVDQVLDIFGDASKEATRYGKALESYSGRLDDPANIDEIRSVVEDIASETKQMVVQYRETDAALHRSTEEIAELRVNIQLIEREALTDPLTGIANRKQLDLFLADTLAERDGNGPSAALLMLDIDHFKKFNDTHGHPVGDQVLKLVAKSLVDSIKGRDLAGRYGGEEFLIVLPSTELANAVTLANQIRVAIGSRSLVNRNTHEKIGRITVSIGVAAQHPGEGADTLIERADKALYTAKNNGRDQVIGEGSGRPKLIVRA